MNTVVKSSLQRQAKKENIWYKINVNMKKREQNNKYCTISDWVCSKVEICHRLLLLLKYNYIEILMQHGDWFTVTDTRKAVMTPGTDGRHFGGSPLPLAENLGNDP